MNIIWMYKTLKRSVKLEIINLLLILTACSVVPRSSLHWRSIVYSPH